MGAFSSDITSCQAGSRYGVECRTEPAPAADVGQRHDVVQGDTTVRPTAWREVSAASPAPLTAPLFHCARGCRDERANLWTALASAIGAVRTKCTDFLPREPPGDVRVSATLFFDESGSVHHVAAELTNVCGAPWSNHGLHGQGPTRQDPIRCLLVDPADGPKLFGCIQSALDNPKLHAESPFHQEVSFDFTLVHPIPL